MAIEFQDTSSSGFRLRYFQTPLSKIALDELRNIISDLNDVSDSLGCVVFEGDGSSEKDLVIFAGNLERFAMLSAARGLGSRTFYFQDTISWWYGGSSILPDLNGISAFLLEHVSKRRCLAFGQSSGGYAALAIGGFINHCDVLACSPQTFPDANIKSNFVISGSLQAQKCPDYILDLAQLYNSTERLGSASAIFSASEHRNPYQSHFWMDHLHMAHISNVTSIKIYVAASGNHSIMMRRAAMFSDCLSELLKNESNKSDNLRILGNLMSKIDDTEPAIA